MKQYGERNGREGFHTSDLGYSTVDIKKDDSDLSINFK